MSSQAIQFARLAVYWKILVSGFLLILGSGYLAAVANVILAIGLSPATIAEHYGPQTLSVTETRVIKEQGFIEEEISLDDEMADMDASVDTGMDMAAGQSHQTGTVHDGAMHHQMENITGEAVGAIKPQQLAQLAHIHWLAFSFMFISLGGLACLSGLGDRVKTVLVGVLALSLFCDIASLILVRFVATPFAWLTVLAGTLVGLCLLMIMCRVLWECWLQAAVIEQGN